MVGVRVFCGVRPRQRAARFSKLPETRAGLVVNALTFEVKESKRSPLSAAAFFATLSLLKTKKVNVALDGSGSAQRSCS